VKKLMRPKDKQKKN
jgi:hypothetical protein